MFYRWKCTTYNLYKISFFSHLEFLLSHIITLRVIEKIIFKSQLMAAHWGGCWLSAIRLSLGCPRATFQYQGDTMGDWAFVSASRYSYFPEPWQESGSCMQRAHPQKQPKRVQLHAQQRSWGSGSHGPWCILSTSQSTPSGDPADTVTQPQHSSHRLEILPWPRPAWGRQRTGP